MNKLRIIISKIFDKSKTIISDMFLNIISSLLPIFFLQFLILPIVAKSYSDTKYGLMLTLISLVTVSVQSLSVSLSNSRLLLDLDYKEKNVNGDFNVLLIVYSLINFFVVGIGVYYYLGNIDIIDISSIILFSAIQLIRRYLLVSFRLKLNYKNILYSNLLLMGGYFVGLLLFFLIPKWQIIYIVGEIVSFYFVLKNSNLLKEPYRSTYLFKKTTKYSIIILGASFLGSAFSHIDRLLLYPLLGPKMVAVYYVSTLFGKMISMLVGPINNVILSYLSKMNKFSVGKFRWMIIISSCLGVVSYLVVVLISEPVLKLLYPMYANDALKLIYITTLTAIFMMLSNVINPIIMKFCNISWQIWVNLSNIIAYLILAYWLAKAYGILGFCFAALFAAILKFIMLIYVYWRNYKQFT